MRVRLGEAAMVSDDFRSTDTVCFPTCLDGLRKHFLDVSRVLDTTDIDFRRHGICGAKMDAADTAQTLIEVLLECDVPDAVQLNLVLAQVEAATLDDEFGLGQGVLCKRQRQRKDGVAFAVSPENFLLVQIDAELAVFEGGHDMTPFVMRFVLFFGTTFIMSILYHDVMILAIIRTFSFFGFDARRCRIDLKSKCFIIQWSWVISPNKLFKSIKNCIT